MTAPTELTLVPGRAFVFGTNGIQDLGLPRFEEVFQRQLAHAGINLQAGNTQHRAELFEQKENDAVVNQARPVASSNEIAFFTAEARFLEAGFLIRQKCLATLLDDQTMKKSVQTVRLHAVR